MNSLEEVFYFLNVSPRVAVDIRRMQTEDQLQVSVDVEGHCWLLPGSTYDLHAQIQQSEAHKVLRLPKSKTRPHTKPTTPYNIHNIKWGPF